MAEEDLPTDKERLDAYITLYKQQMERFGKTQEIEWKGNFGVWGLLAGAIYLRATSRPTISIPSCFVGLILIMIFVVHLLWLSFIHVSERFDKKLWVNYRIKALDIIQPGHGDGQFEHSWFKETVWLSLEAGMTGLLCLVLFFWH